VGESEKALYQHQGTRDDKKRTKTKPPENCPLKVQRKKAYMKKVTAKYMQGEQKRTPKGMAEKEKELEKKGKMKNVPVPKQKWNATLEPGTVGRAIGKGQFAK